MMSHEVTCRVCDNNERMLKVPDGYRASNRCIDCSCNYSKFATARSRVGLRRSFGWLQIAEREPCNG